MFTWNHNTATQMVDQELAWFLTALTWIVHRQNIMFLFKKKTSYKFLDYKLHQEGIRDSLWTSIQNIWTVFYYTIFVQHNSMITFINCPILINKREYLQNSVNHLTQDQFQNKHLDKFHNRYFQEGLHYTGQYSCSLITKWHFHHICQWLH